MAWLPSSIRHILPLRVWLSQREVLGKVGAQWERRAEEHCGELLISPLSPPRLLEFVQSGAIFSLCWDIAAAPGRRGLPPR